MGSPIVNLEALNQYLDEVRDEPFVWGQHDCLTFTNTAFHKMYGEGWCDDWLGRYMNGDNLITNTQLKEEFGFDTLEEGITTKLTKIEYIPPRGALVAISVPRRFLTGRSFGISLGTKCVFLSALGLVYSNVEAAREAYIR